MLSIAATGDGLLDLAEWLMDQDFSMSESLAWFGGPMKTPKALDAEAADWLKADAHASWAIFDYIT